MVSVNSAIAILGDNSKTTMATYAAFIMARDSPSNETKLSYR